MDPDSLCSGSCSGSSSNDGSVQWHRSLKRRHEHINGNNRNDSDFPSVARVEVEDEYMALREIVSSQQQTIQELYTELEEERNASSTAANEAMSMILRLQRDKAEVQMEARQFKRYAEEKMAHDQEELLSLEDLLYKRDQLIQALNCEIQAYKHRMMSYGVDQSEIEDARLNCGSPMSGQWERLPSFAKHGHGRSLSMGEKPESWNVYTTEESNQFVCPEEALASGTPRLPHEYPPLRCRLNETQVPHEFGSDDIDFEKYAAGETPREQLQNLERRIYQLERTPSNHYLDGEWGGTRNILERPVVGQFPRRSRHVRRFSNGSSGSFSGLVREVGQESGTGKFSKLRPNGSLKRMVDYSNTEDYSCSRKMDNTSEFADDMSDRIYTIDSVQGVQSGNGGLKREFGDGNGFWLGDQDVLPERNNVRSALGSPYAVERNVQSLRNSDCDRVGVPDYDVMECKPAFVIREDYANSPRESLYRIDTEEGEIKKLYMRLQALEADRESMRQAIVSMRTDKAQLILLKEIAQHLCKELSPERKISVKKPSLVGSFSVMAGLKWIVSFVFWRRKAHRSKFQFGLSGNNLGLLLLLDKSPPTRHRRCLTKARV